MCVLHCCADFYSIFVCLFVCLSAVIFFLNVGNNEVS